MPGRFALLAFVLTSPLCAQFSGLSPTPDGSAVYFTATLRLKGAPPLLNGKIYLATQDGVKLFRARDRSAPPANSPGCTVGGFSDYVSAETAAGGVVALSFAANSISGCSFPTNRFETEIIDSSSDTVIPGNVIPGNVRLSANGRYGIVYLAATGRPGSAFTLSLLDRQTGVQTPIDVPAPSFPESVTFGGGRVVANDGTAILGITDFSTRSRGYLLKPGADPQPFAVSDGLPLMIDAAASKVVYQRQRAIYLLDLKTLASTLLVPAGQPAFGFRISDDARRLTYIGDAQLHVIDITTLTDRVLTNDPAHITEAALTADGNFAFAVTGTNRLLKINTADGTQTEWIGRTPYFVPFNSSVPAGFTTVLTGGALSDAVYNATVPLKQYLGNVTMWIGDRKVPVIQLTPAGITFLPPWDIAPGGTTIRMLAEAPGDHTPFYFPEAEGTVAAFQPQAGAIARQDWS
ncbi:MAG: hypothetical protein JWP63_1675, partial [Candidatus Solibacter sp.]|nr:hypothetical protein [Candidatus Solibacter sp.]